MFDEKALKVEEIKDFLLAGSLEVDLIIKNLPLESQQIKDPRLLSFKQLVEEEIYNTSLLSFPDDYDTLAGSVEQRRLQFRERMRSFIDVLIFFLQNDNAYKKLFLRTCNRFNPYLLRGEGIAPQITQR